MDCMNESRHTMNRRAGFTLIELLVAMSLFAVIAPLAGWMIFLLLRAQTASADSLADAMTLSRFANTFRADAHSAHSARVDGEQVVSDHSTAGEHAVLTLEGRRGISYTAEPAGIIVRFVRNGTRTERREEFHLVGTQTHFERNATEGTLAAVHAPRSFRISTAGRAATSSIMSAPTIRIEAVIGRDQRLQPSSQAVAPGPPPPPLPKIPAGKGART